MPSPASFESVRTSSLRPYTGALGRAKLNSDRSKSDSFALTAIEKLSLHETNENGLLAKLHDIEVSAQLIEAERQKAVYRSTKLSRKILMAAQGKPESTPEPVVDQALVDLNRFLANQVQEYRQSRSRYEVTPQASPAPVQRKLGRIASWRAARRERTAAPNIFERAIDRVIAAPRARKIVLGLGMAATALTGLGLVAHHQATENAPVTATAATSYESPSTTYRVRLNPANTTTSTTVNVQSLAASGVRQVPAAETTVRQYTPQEIAFKQMNDTIESFKREDPNATSFEIGAKAIDTLNLAAWVETHQTPQS